MTEKEKAIAYDEAIRKLRGMMPNWERLSYNGKTFLQDLIHIFPELAESEDERIRKMLIKFFGKGAEYNSSTNGIFDKDILTWLEKQGTSYTKRDVDDAYVEGMAFAKNELEKQKSSWSEDDENYYDAIITKLEVTQDDAALTDNQMEFLKSLKDKVQPKPVWSEEDETGLTNTIIMLKEGASLHFNKKDIAKAVNWLETIKQRIGG